MWYKVNSIEMIESVHIYSIQALIMECKDCGLDLGLGTKQAYHDHQGPHEGGGGEGGTRVNKGVSGWGGG